MSVEYRNNHYVPKWYQKRFTDTTELYYLNLKPELIRNPGGHTHFKKNPRKLGFDYCFAQDDLYTTSFKGIDPKAIEKTFFGNIDGEGKNAVEDWSKFKHINLGEDSFNNLLLYMSTQRLRTPKGLSWLKEKTGTENKNLLLSKMIQIKQMYAATWADCVWQIADASLSDTKFILSDHPVSFYNKAYGPRSGNCAGHNDPDILLNGTHTIFPLSKEKILIMSNLSWVRNPYQKPTTVKPNPRLFRNTIFKLTEVQLLRTLSEEEVRQINFIIKSRAYKYIAAEKEEWLYPEKYVSKSDWNNFGYGYLLMPDPRSVVFSGEIMWGGPNGGGAMDEYGRHPWDLNYSKESKEHKEFDTLHRFQGEFARLFGKKRRGRAFNFTELDEEFDSDEYHQIHLDQEAKYKKIKGPRSKK
jgi:Protein of unknown function (DUF4238)